VAEAFASHTWTAERADKEVSDVFANLIEETAPPPLKQKKAAQELTGDLLEAERILARRVELIPRPGEWRAFFLRLLLKGFTEYLRRSTKPTAQLRGPTLQALVVKWLGPETSALPTLKAVMLDVEAALVI
jgi:hypothetical protein